MIRADDCIFHPDNNGGWLRSLRTFSRIRVEFVEEGPERPLDGFDAGGEDLHVLVHKPVVHAGILEFLNRLVAERFDLPTRIVTVELGKFGEGYLKGEGESSDPALSVLLRADLVHLVTPRPLWIEYRAKHAANMVRRQAAFRTPSREGAQRNALVAAMRAEGV